MFRMRISVAAGLVMLALAGALAACTNPAGALDSMVLSQFEFLHAYR